MDNNLAEDSFSIVGLFDNEEIGSLTRQGARGGLIELVVDRVLSSNFYNPEVLDIQESLRLTYANSIVLSADVNHLFNPNFPGVYLEHHKPLPNIGVTLSWILMVIWLLIQSVLPWLKNWPKEWR